MTTKKRACPSLWPVLLLICLLVRPAMAKADESFAAWLEGVRAEALAQGVRPATLDAALTGLRPNKLVLRLDRRQPEFSLSLKNYLARTVNEARVAKGRRLLAAKHDLLRQVAAKYHVQPRFLMALYGIETDYGRVTGGFPVIEALATLAHDPRRSAFFRRELLAALRIVDAGHVTVKNFEGSWAGAFGGMQFLPSVFLAHAVDEDGDGRIDLYHSLPDMFASAARYLAAMGWDDSTTWGRPVRLPHGFDRKLLGVKHKEMISHWQRLGVRRANGGNLPRRELAAAIIVPDRKAGDAFMVYGNFDALMGWNHSLYYGVAVGRLADRLAQRVSRRKQ